MIHLTKVYTLLFSLFLFSCNNDKKDDTEKGSLLIKPREFNFGTISYNDSVKCSFSLQNISTHEVKIKKISTSCNCTNANHDGDIISPHSSRNIFVTFKGNSENVGLTRETVVIETDTPERFYELSILGTLVK